jgi:hypothetical protein
MRCTQLDWTSDANAIIESVAHSVCSVDIPEHSAIGSVSALPTCNAVGRDITWMHNSAAFTMPKTMFMTSRAVHACAQLRHEAYSHAAIAAKLWAVAAAQHCKQESTESHSERKVVPCKHTAQLALFVMVKSAVAKLTRTNSRSCIESVRKVTLCHQHVALTYTLVRHWPMLI